MNKAELLSFVHLQFEQISSLWREREGQEFVSREELHVQIAATMDFTKENEQVKELALAGVNTALDQFAKTGPNEKAFIALVVDFTEPQGLYWRYAVERDDVLGYVRVEDLAPEECDELIEKLTRESDDAIVECSELELLRELLVPYFITPTTTAGEAYAALKAKLDSGDQAERERYESFLLRGLRPEILLAQNPEDPAG